MQAQVNRMFGLNRTNSRVSIDSITSFVGSTQSKSDFQKFCQNLYQMGIRADDIKEKESEILNIFNRRDSTTSGQIYGIVGQSKPHDVAISGQIDDSIIADQSQLLTVSDFP